MKVNWQYPKEAGSRKVVYDSSSEFKSPLAIYRNGVGAASMSVQNLSSEGLLFEGLMMCAGGRNSICLFVYVTVEDIMHFSETG